MKFHDVAFWKEEINDEMDSIMDNNTWVLTDLPPRCRPLGCKWIFKRKLKVDGTVEKFMERLVIQDFKQKSGIDYFDTYAPVARISTIRLLIAMTSIHSLIIHEMDVKTAFLNGELEEEIYMNQPLGFILPGNENKGKSISLSEQQLVDCAGDFDNFGCKGGLPSQAYEYIKYNGGLDSEEAYPYTESMGAEDELKYAVGLVRPVSVAFQVINNFILYTGGVFTSDNYGSDPMDVNHAVVAVGYGEENSVPYWLIKNSWGAD
ncbi:zinc finger, CCHC-type containing protein [Tanacetum coccineum]